jgi:hypoxanthine phosphoribosyltransferase
MTNQTDLQLRDGSKVRVRQIIGKNKIKDRVHALAGEILEVLTKKNTKDITVVSIMTGSLVFTADLIRAFVGKHKNDTLKDQNDTLSIEVEIVKVSSYTKTVRGSPKLELGLSDPKRLNGRQVLLVDDIVESGETLHLVYRLLKDLGAKVMTVVLLQKENRQLEKFAVPLDFVGFRNEPKGDEFAIGYGLDLDAAGRQLNWIGVKEKEN